ncbi:unnamed protein product [Caenorhabditis angaria]|uniref:C-type lectin domain-containing protein n=1 Tax=Caenorhabditis angaria TaxID=860376 RepID=A0A9P1N721_9PELO|nr:unnamed protein product [Caenorhabditis angaria]
MNRKIFAFLLLICQSSEACLTSCDPGFVTIQRTPTAANKCTRRFCLKIANSSDALSHSDAEDLCSKDGEKLAMFESLDEQNLFSEYLQPNVHIRIDGVRRTECILPEDLKDTEKCSPQTAFIALNAGTDPTFTFNNWSDNDPNHDYVNIDEQCLILRNGRGTNDISCNATPNTQFATYMALCGKFPN